MCGITGIFDLYSQGRIDKEVLQSMADALNHRGPDDSCVKVEKDFGIGFKRLSIIDLAHGQQPFYNADRSVVLICNGEIYNYKELRRELVKMGYSFKTNCDVEVIVHAYEAYGTTFLNRLNGQFAFALYDKNQNLLFCARDQFGICPFFYTLTEKFFLFGSEIKSIIKNPTVKRSVDLTGLDQVFTFPGNVSPTTLFKNIRSLKPGNFLIIKGGKVLEEEYWDLEYPDEPSHSELNESYYLEKLEDLMLKSVTYRLNSDVPVGFYLSGGLDSSLIAALIKKINPRVNYESFSITFPEELHAEYDEHKYQRMVSKSVNSIHNEIPFSWSDVNTKLHEAIFYSECPLKETYNTCSLALSKAVRNKNIKVVLSGEGADELFGGYVGYRFDVQRQQIKKEMDLEDLLEEQYRQKLWGDGTFIYERQELDYKETKKAIYSEKLNQSYPAFDSLTLLELNRDRLKNKHVFHKRSYLDLKLRLSDHLVADHCDRVCYANSVEGRYPFLDIELLDFIKTIPPHLKLNGLTEKYILKQLGAKYLPQEIINRQKFSFVAPGSPELLKNKVDWVQDILSYETIKRQGYFNPDTVERIKKMYVKDNFKLNLPFDNDLLIIVITFGIFLEIFNMPDI